MFKAAVSVGQYVPGNSLIHSLDPRTKVLGVVLTASAIFVVTGWLGLGLAAGFVFMVIGFTGVHPWRYFKGMSAIWALLLVTFALNLFLTPGETLLNLGFLQINKEGLVFGGQMFIRLVLLILIAFTLTLTTSPVNLTAGLESLLAPLKKLGAPAHEIAMIMTIALRFVPTLMTEADKIAKAQSSRGAGFGRGGLFSRVKGLLPLFVPLFVSAIRSAEELATAMEARCYRGGANRTRMNNLELKARDYTALLITVAALSLSIWFKRFAA